MAAPNAPRDALPSVRPTRPPPRSRVPCLLLLSLAGAGGAGCQPLASGTLRALRHRAAEELSCPAHRLQVARIDDRAYRVTGCGKRATVLVSWTFTGVCAAQAVICGDPRQATDLIRRAGELYQHQEYEEAVLLYERFLRDHAVHRDAPEAWLMLGGCYYRLGLKHQRAEYGPRERHALRELIRRHPTSPRRADALLYLGQTYSGHHATPGQSTDYRQAIALYEQAILAAERDWIKAQARGRIGQCHERLGRPDLARAAYQEVQQKYPGTPWFKVAAELEKKLDRPPR